MYRNVEVKTWVGIQGRCPMSYIIDRSGAVDLQFGNPPNDFEFGFDPESLRLLLTVVQNALRDLDERQGDQLGA